MGKISILAFLTCACSPRVGWTAWPIWRNLENTFKERYQKVGKCAKNVILQEKSKKTRKTLQDVFCGFWWFWTDSDGFYWLKHANSWFFNDILSKIKGFWYRFCSEFMIFHWFLLEKSWICMFWSIKIIRIGLKPSKTAKYILERFPSFSRFFL